MHKHKKRIYRDGDHKERNRETKGEGGGGQEVEEVMLQTTKVTHGSLAHGNVSSLASKPKIKFSTDALRCMPCSVLSETYGLTKHVHFTTNLAEM